MERSEFIKKCGVACLGAVGLSAMIQSCTPAQQLTAPIVNNQLVIPLSAFQTKTKNGEQHKRYLVIRNEQLNYPLILFRDQPEQYTALLLRCSHQYNELNVNGELLTCPAHGSEFDSKGNVVSGPAEDKLRSFQTSTDNQNIYIQLA